MRGETAMKKGIAVLLVCVFSLFMIVPAFADSVEDDWDDDDVAIAEDDGSLDNFTATRTYQNNFQDVPASEWYYSVVKASYEYGLIDGTSQTKFSPNAQLTIAQCIKLAACLNQIFYYGEVSLTNAKSGSWYTTYVTYCLEQGILTAKPTDYNRAITRAEAADLFSKALPAEVLPAIKTVQDGAIPDVSMSSAYADAVYTMYRAGIFTGTNAAGNFSPNGHLLRSQVAAMLARMADPNLRVK
jgi:hypothetical protein